MNPDRSNYEIWIIDWLDGKLDKTAAEKLMAFLEANPDLREEADSLYLTQLPAGADKFRAKDSLKKTAADLPLQQVELLSVAYLENDITHEQLSDLKQFTDLSNENKKVFDTIQKTRLTPPHVVYKNKNSLKKQTPGAKVFRLASIGLSAAAATAILISGYIFLSRYTSDYNPEGEQVNASVSLPAPASEERTKVYTAPAGEPAGKDLNKAIPVVSPRIISAGVKTTQTAVLAAADTTPVIARSSIPEIRHIPVSVMPEIMPVRQELLIATTNNRFIIESYDEDRSRVSRFIARTFREKILKEPVLNDAPIKSYEIAEAGIDGLNKLLGWDMTLVMNNDEEGDLKSVYFSSRLLKFNAPVKKSEPLP